MTKKISIAIIERVAKINHKVAMLNIKRDLIISKEIRKKEISYNEFETEYEKTTNQIKWA